jgi:hypothetical protein
MLKLSRPERGLLGAVLLFLVVAVWGSSITQPIHQHAFADQRLWAQIPNAMDVLSNLPFALWGTAGLVCLFGRRFSDASPWSSMQTRVAATFFTGLILTASASAWYHLQPTDASLLVDRLGMVFAFAGLLGLAGADRVSTRAGVALAAGVLLVGPLSVAWWSATGNVLPWLAMQFGGLLLIAGAACLPGRLGALDVRWGWVVLIYLAAKLLEVSDAAVFELSHHWMSGHSAKHIVASFAAWPVLTAITQSQKSRAESASASQA